MEYINTPIGLIKIWDKSQVKLCPNLLGSMIIIALTFKGWAVLLEILKNSTINGNVAVMIFLICSMIVPALIWSGMELILKIFILWLQK